MTHTYSITGMTCSSCVAKVKNELLKMGDIESAHLQLQSPQAVITMNKHIPVTSLQLTISKAGTYNIKEADSGIKHNNSSVLDKTGSDSSYFPIFLIFGYIAGVTLLVQLNNNGFDLMQWMQHFMAGFFIVFSFFKLMNLRGFAEGYGSYDIVAKQFPAWGFIYPFVELALGILFLTGLESRGTAIATFIVMGVSSIGVIQSLLQKKVFQCACLGTIIKLPLSKVTLFEDLLMVFMSAMILLG
ncbi:MAG: MauE/DoxX family redox-associated membrane protein [Bacteroidota bacterium]